MLQLQTGQTIGLPVAGIAAESALAAVQALDALAVASAPLFTTGWSTLEEIRKTRDKVAAVYTAAGGKPEEAPHAAQRYVFVTNDRDEALRAADGARYIRRIALSMRNQYARVHGAWLEEIAASDEPPLDVTADRLIVGDAERCAAKLAEEITALRPTHISCFMAISGIEPKRVLESMERFGGEVMPLLTKHFGGFDRVGAAEPRSASAAAAA